LLINSADDQLYSQLFCILVDLVKVFYATWGALSEIKAVMVTMMNELLDAFQAKKN